MKRITRDVHPSALWDLLERPPHAYLAFNDGTAVDAAPVAFRFSDERFYVGLGADLAPLIAIDAPVTLLLDKGWYWYELQSIRLRGTIRPAAIPGAPPGVTWFEVVPRTVTAWDYGALREVQDDETK
jgi:hypothetical protein